MSILLGLSAVLVIAVLALGLGILSHVIAGVVVSVREDPPQDALEALRRGSVLVVRELRPDAVTPHAKALRDARRESELDRADQARRRAEEWSEPWFQHLR